MVCKPVRLALVFVLSTLLLVGLFALAGMAGAAPNTPAVERRVCATGCTYTSIQAAVDAAIPGDIIKVATGVYTGVVARPLASGSGTVTQVVHITKTIILMGGYDSAFTEPPAPMTNTTVINAMNMGRVLYIGGAISPTITGFQLTGGNATGQEGGVGTGNGGGVLVDGASPTLYGVSIAGNQAPGDGGGFYASQGNPTLQYSMVTGNVSGADGGGVAIGVGSATISECAISLNFASGNGGGVHIAAFAPGRLLTSGIYSNTAGADGGGVYIMSSGWQVQGSGVMTNTASDGGGLYLVSSNAFLAGNYVAANRAITDAGGMRVSSGAPQFVNNRFVRNLAGRFDGGVEVSASNAVFTNTLIADNAASTRGGLYVFTMGERPRFVHTTIARNGTHGIYYSGTSGTLVLTNTILVSHTVGVNVAIGNSMRMAGTLWGTGEWANLTEKTGSGTLTRTGDVTGTPAFANYLRGDYRLSYGSAAIDRGLMAGVFFDIDMQQRPAGPGFDLGFDEAVLPPLRGLYLPLLSRIGVTQ